MFQFWLPYDQSYGARMRYRIVVNFLGLLPGNLCALTRSVHNVKHARQTHRQSYNASDKSKRGEEKGISTGNRFLKIFVQSLEPAKLNSTKHKRLRRLGNQGALNRTSEYKQNF